MQVVLKCNNGKEIDFTSIIIQQMEGKLTREEVECMIAQTKCENVV